MKQSYHFLFVLFLICFTSKLYPQSVPSYVPNNGLVAWWPFSGNAGDLSGNQNHGIVHGATLTTDRNGQHNSAYLFVPGQWITIPNSPTISVQQSITISIWFYMDGGGCNPRLFQIHQNSNNCGGYAMSTPGTSNVNRTLNAYFGSCSSEIYIGNQTPIPALSWQHIAMTIDGVNGIGKLYWNGQLLQTLLGSSIPIFSYNNNPITIGNINPGRCDWWGGKIDDFGIWNRALTQQEITNLYNFQFPTQTSLCLPSVTTNTPTSIGIDSVVIGGDILNDGGSSIVLRGVCYSTTPNPNMGNPRTEEGSGIGSFTSTLRNLSPSTTYYARSYAKNSQGVVVYGNDVSFSTGTPIPGMRCPGTPSVTDIDGNLYYTVQIGTQCWTQSNLKVSKYRNGDNISTGLSNSAWENTTAGAYAIYNNDPVNDGLYGKLYNHYAVMDTRGLCPTGWHVPTDGEWNRLVMYLDPNADTVCVSCTQSWIAGGILKGALYPTFGGWNWYHYPVISSNLFGFSALPGGWKNNFGVFATQGNDGVWWSSTLSFMNPLVRTIGYNGDAIYKASFSNNYGNSVRCLKDIVPSVSTTTVSNVTATSATTGGDVTQDGGAPVTARGVAYGTSSGPTTSGTITNDGTGTGVYTSTLAGLTPSTTYYVRAYATNSVGTAYGNEVSFTTAPLSIGSSYAGGIVFDLDSTGQHGLVCAPSNLGDFQWGCQGTGIPNTSTAVGTGATNTAYIVAGCAQRPIAASVCADLVLNGYSDWYLPSLGEMQLMYSRLHLQGLGGFDVGLGTFNWYWSSSQGSPSYAGRMNFSNGNVDNYAKYINSRVRAVRAF